MTHIQRRVEYANLKVDRHLTSILDFEQFLNLCLDTQLEVRIAREIIKEIQSNGQTYLKTLQRRLVKSKRNPEGLCSNGTLALVWKKLLNSGLISRRMRYEPCKLSTQFASRLQEIADYWLKWVEQTKHN